jgi:hypothetical protein
MPERKRFTKSDLLLAALLFAGSLLVRLWLRGSFDGLYGQDAYAYYDFAQALRTSLNGGAAPGPFFWPLGFPALLMASNALSGTTPASAQAVCLVTGALLPVLVYLLSRQLGAGQFGALAGGLLMAVCGQAIQSSIVVMADIPALFWATLSGVLLWWYLQSGITEPAFKQRAWALVGSGVVFALAVITRWLSLALALPWGLALLLAGGVRWRSAALALAGAALVFAPQMLYSRTNPYPTLNHAWVEGWSPANLLQKEFTNVDGHFVYPQVNALFYGQVFSDPYYIWPVLTPFMLIGAWGLWRRRAYPQFCFLLGWALIPYLFLAGIPYQNIRFPLIVFPAVAILTGLGFEWAVRHLSQRISTRLAYAAAAILLLWSIGGMLKQGADTIRVFVANQERDKATANWVRNQLPPASSIYTFGLTLTLQHYTPLHVREIYYETPQTLAADWGCNDYLLLNLWDIQHQWAGREPDTVYQWLRDHRGLTQMGQFGYYTLFRVGSVARTNGDQTAAVEPVDHPCP